jgi:hypothetical protein
MRDGGVASVPREDESDGCTVPRRVSSLQHFICYILFAQRKSTIGEQAFGLASERDSVKVVSQSETQTSRSESEVYRVRGWSIALRGYRVEKSGERVRERRGRIVALVDRVTRVGPSAKRDVRIRLETISRGERLYIEFNSRR